MGGNIHARCTGGSIFWQNDIFSMTLAQDGVAAPPGETTVAPADPAGGGTEAPRGQGGLFPPGFLIVMVGILLVMILLSGGKRGERKKREAMLSAVRKHDKVQTIGGVIGSIVEVKPDHVVLKVDESANIRITFARSAIQQVISSSDKKESASDAAAAD